MEAKDTVVRYQKNHPVVAGSCEWHMIDGYNMGAEAQAEISFKAGGREMIEQYKQDNPSSYKKYKAYWQAKLKEWGL